MFQVFKKKHNKEPEPVVEIVMGAPVYEQLRKRAANEGVSESEELLRALRRGMSDYWLHVVKHETERYRSVEKLFNQSKHDNELLEAIINQNVRFHEILNDEDKGESTVKRWQGKFHHRRRNHLEDR